MLGISLSVLVCVGFREFTGEAPTDYVAPDVDQNVVKKPISDHILSEDNKKIDLPAGDGLAATTTIGSSLLSILNAKQQVIPSQLRSQPTDDIKPEDVPPYLDSSSAPPDFVIVKNFSSYHCQTDFPQGISPVIFDSINMPTLDCLQECSKRKDDCLYAISFLNGTCTLMNNCPVYVSGPVPNTIYGLKEKIVTTEKHRSARGLIEPDLTHLWRLNKTRSNYYFETKPIDLPECVRKLFDEYSRNHPFVDTQIPELGIDHVYMVHYTKLVTRRQVITGLHKLQGITSDWITEFDHQNITSEMRACLHETWEPSSYFNGIKKKRIVPSALTPSFKGGELSVNTKHHFIYYDIVRNKYPFSVIFEDDAKLRTGFREWFSEAVRAVPDNFDIIFFGGCLKLYGWRQKSTATQVSKHVYLKSGSRCAHAYAVTLSGAAKLLNAMPMTEVIDFQINRAILEQNMSVYWIEPWLSVQGPVGEAGQPRATATTGGDGEPYNPSNYGDPKWVATWQQGVPNILPGKIKIPKTSSAPICDKGKNCWWL